MITIQGFARLCGCNTQTLRYYDRIGLLAPARVDEWTGYRYYEEEQAMLFVRIKNLQQADFSLRRSNHCSAGMMMYSQRLTGKWRNRNRNWRKSVKYKNHISKK
jgi:hypothetical protein